ncbi:MAG: putative toxin [Bacillota bacterium]
MNIGDMSGGIKNVAKPVLKQVAKSITKKVANLIYGASDVAKYGDEVVKGASKSGTDLARQLGKEGEDAAGIVNAKQRIPSLSGTAKYRIPDELLQDPKILREIKNVSSQSYTNQLKDFNARAKKNGYQFILEVRPGAKLSGPLQEAIDKGEVILKYIGQ